MTVTKTATIDRRVARTRRTLHDALLTLMGEKGYEAVTVEDICVAADVGRSTFYAHFTGKEDLKRRGLDERLGKALRERRQQAEARGEGSFAFALALFEHARDHLDLYRALVAKGGAATTLTMIRQIVTEQVRRELAANGGNDRSADAPPREVVVQFVAGALMSVLTWWLDGGAKLPAHRIGAVFRRLATRGAP